MGNVLIFAEHQGGHFPKTTLTAIHAGLDLANVASIHQELRPIKLTSGMVPRGTAECWWT